MKRIKTFLLAFVLLISVLIPNISGNSVSAETTIAEDEAMVKDLEQKLDGVQSRLNDIRRKVSNAESDYDNLLDLTEELTYQLNSISSELDSYNATYKKYESLVSEKEKKINDMTSALSEKYETFKKRLITIHEYGYEDYYAFLLNSDDFSDFLSRSDYMKDIMEYDREVIEDMMSEVDSLKAARDSYKTAQEKCLELLNQLSANAEELKAQKKANDSMISKAKENLQYYLDLEAAIEAEEREIDKQIAKKVAEIEAKKSYNYSGAMLWPLPSGANRYCSSKYGYRTHPVTGKPYSFHNGIDLPAPEGTKIYAVASGEVITAVPTLGSTYGKYVVIYHGDGMQTLYAHCSSLAVKEGDVVKAGQVIGYVGSTGRSTGNHLHISVYKNGNTVNPFDYLNPPW